MFSGCFKEVSRVFHGSFMEEKVSRMFLRVFHDFQGFFMVFLEIFKKTFKVFQKKVSCCMTLIAASRAEGGLVALLNYVMDG